jgi:hypothetical protein
MSLRASFNLPEYHDRPKRIDGVWTLHKGKHTATCELWTHPIGGEIRLEAAGEFQRSEAGRDGLKLIDLAMEWKQQFVVKGWSE